VIVFEPFYTNYNGFAAMIGVELVPVTTRRRGTATTCRRGAAIGGEDRAAHARGAHLLAQQPTGTVYRDAEIDLLAAICASAASCLIADRGLPRVRLTTATSTARC